MALSYEELQSKKHWLADEVTKSIKETFNKEGIEVTSGIAMNDAREMIFALRIMDLNNPDEAPASEIVDFAKQRAKNLVPESDADVIGMALPRLA